MEEKKRFIEGEQRCDRCLKRGHKLEECRDQIPCRSCKGSHHCVFCNKRTKPAIAACLNVKKNTRQTSHRPSMGGRSDVSKEGDTHVG